MAKSLLTVLVQTSKSIERDRKKRERASVREYNAALRRAEQASKAEEKAIRMMEKAELADRKAMERAKQKDYKALDKAIKLAHIENMKATTEEQNLKLIANYEDIDRLLEHTLDIDDFVDLERLRRTNETPPFDAGELSIANKTPASIKLPKEPVFIAPPKPKGLFGKKKKLAQATAEAQENFEKADIAWKSEVELIKTENKRIADAHALLEQGRLKRLDEGKKKFECDVIKHNESLDSLINNLGYGTTDAIEEYISIVVANSAYPDHFQVEHSFTFNPDSAELSMQVSIPPPDEIENEKSYKYKQSTDEIVSTLLSMKAQKDRYNGAAHQVAIRSFHEVFEADRRGLINTISLEVGTKAADPATGKFDFITLIAVAAERNAFLEFDLSSVVVIATLKHLGAVISKNPFELIGVESNGVRKS